MQMLLPPFLEASSPVNQACPGQAHLAVGWSAAHGHIACVHAPGVAACIVVIDMSDSSSRYLERLKSLQEVLVEHWQWLHQSRSCLGTCRQASAWPATSSSMLPLSSGSR